MLDPYTNNLYCEEDSGDWDGYKETSLSLSAAPSSSSSSLLKFSFPHSDDDKLTNVKRLVNSESDHVPDPNYINRYRYRDLVMTARENAIIWIMKVHGHYQFKPVTGFLSVNYFDRFLSGHHLRQEEEEWSFQLLSVACLSLAAKLEETGVPPLPEIQIFEPKFFFESKTIQKMEIFVMEKLNWRLRSITPFDYVDYFMANLPCHSSSPESKHKFYSKVSCVTSDLMQNTVYKKEFLGLLPSAIAAAAVTYAAGTRVEIPMLFYNGENKDGVRSCNQLMKLHLRGTYMISNLKHRVLSAPAPLSHEGFLDILRTSNFETQSSDEESIIQQKRPASRRLRSSIAKKKSKKINRGEDKICKNHRYFTFNFPKV